MASQEKLLAAIPEEDLAKLGAVQGVYSARTNMVRILCWVGALFFLAMAGLLGFLTANPSKENPQPHELMVAITVGAALVGLVFAAMAMLGRSRSFVAFRDVLVEIESGEGRLIPYKLIDEIYEDQNLPYNATFRFKTRDGKLSDLDTTVENYMELGEMAEQKLVDRLLPESLAKFDAGETVPFGPMSVSRQGFQYKGKIVAWGEIASFEIKVNEHLRRRYLEVALPGAWTLFCSLPLKSVPNHKILRELVRRAQPNFL